MTQQISMLIGKSRDGKAMLCVTPAVRMSLKDGVAFSNGEAFLAIDKADNGTRPWKHFNKTYPYAYNIPKAVSGKWPVFGTQAVHAIVGKDGRLTLEKPNVDAPVIVRKRRTTTTSNGVVANRSNLDKVQEAVRLLNDMQERKELDMSVRDGRLRVRISTVIS